MLRRLRLLFLCRRSLLAACFSPRWSPPFLPSKSKSPVAEVAVVDGSLKGDQVSFPLPPVALSFLSLPFETSLPLFVLDDPRTIKSVESQALLSFVPRSECNLQIWFFVDERFFFLLLCHYSCASSPSLFPSKPAACPPSSSNLPRRRPSTSAASTSATFRRASSSPCETSSSRSRATWPSARWRCSRWPRSLAAVGGRSSGSPSRRKVRGTFFALWILRSSFVSVKVAERTRVLRQGRRRGPESSSSSNSTRGRRRWMFALMIAHRFSFFSVRRRCQTSRPLDLFSHHALSPQHTKHKTQNTHTPPQARPSWSP